MGGVEGEKVRVGGVEGGREIERVVGMEEREWGWRERKSGRDGGRERETGRNGVRERESERESRGGRERKRVGWME